MLHRGKAGFVRAKTSHSALLGLALPSPHQLSHFQCRFLLPFWFHLFVFLVLGFLNWGPLTCQASSVPLASIPSPVFLCSFLRCGLFTLHTQALNLQSSCLSQRSWSYRPTPPGTAAGWFLDPGGLEHASSVLVSTFQSQAESRRLISDPRVPHTHYNWRAAVYKQQGFLTDGLADSVNSNTWHHQAPQKHSYKMDERRSWGRRVNYLIA